MTSGKENISSQDTFRDRYIGLKLNRVRTRTKSKPDFELLIENP